MSVGRGVSAPVLPLGEISKILMASRMASPKATLRVAPHRYAKRGPLGTSRRLSRV